MRKVYTIVFLTVEIFLIIMNNFISFTEKEIVVIGLTLLGGVFCALCCRFSNGTQNMFFPSVLYNMNHIILFILFLILGGAPIIFQFSFGRIYRFHHIINNVVTIPLTLTALVKYVAKLERMCNAVTVVNQYKKGIVHELSSLL